MIGPLLSSMLAQAAPTVEIPPGGGYVSIAKIVAMLVLIFPWLYLAPIVSKDVLRVRASQPLWSSIILGAGALGVLVWLLLPYYFVGMLVYLFLTASTFLAYVAYRNGRVPEEHKILTGEHLAGLFKKKHKVIVKPVVKVKVYGADSKVVYPPADGATEQDILVYNFVQEFLYDMLWRRASEADIVPSTSDSAVRFVIDGMLTQRTPMNLVDSESLVQYLKSVSGMNLEERRRPQKGTMTMEIPGTPATKVVLTSAGTTGGQRMQFRVQQQIVQTRLGELGMAQTTYDNVRTAIRQTGLVIVSGRSGSGVTSTLYSLLREHDAFTLQLATFEKSPAIELENITQTRYESDDQLAPALASALRRDFDVMMIDECTDTQAAQMLAEAGAEKHITLGQSGTDTFVALAKWIKVCGNADLAMQNLRGILCQMLVRKLCLNCREAYKPDPQMLVKANLPRDIDLFYRTPTKPRVDEEGTPIICQNCQGTGYYGRTAAFEYLELTDDLRQLVASGASVNQIKAACRKKGMLYLQEQALAKVIDGVTSIQEVIRVSQQTAKEAK